MKKRWMILLVILIALGGRIAWVNYNRVPVRTYRVGQVIQMKDCAFSVQRFYRASPKEREHFMELEKEVWGKKFEEMSDLYNKPISSLYILEVESESNIESKYFEAIYKKDIAYQVIKAYLPGHATTSSFHCHYDPQSH